MWAPENGYSGAGFQPAALGILPAKQQINLYRRGLEARSHRQYARATAPENAL